MNWKWKKWKVRQWMCSVQCVDGFGLVSERDCNEVDLRAGVTSSLTDRWCCFTASRAARSPPEPPVSRFCLSDSMCLMFSDLSWEIIVYTCEERRPARVPALAAQTLSFTATDGRIWWPCHYVLTVTLIHSQNKCQINVAESSASVLNALPW